MGAKKGCGSTSKEIYFLNGSKFNSKDSRHLIGQMGIVGPQISEGHFSIHFRVDYFRVAPNTVLNPPYLNTSEPHFRTPKHALKPRRVPLVITVPYRLPVCNLDADPVRLRVRPFRAPGITSDRRLHAGVRRGWNSLVLPSFQI